MLIVNPSVEIITADNALQRIELAGRVCYKSEGKITNKSARSFVERLVKMGHMTPLEHARIVIPDNHYYNLMKNTWDTPYGMEYRVIRTKIKSTTNENNGGFALNVRDYLALGGDFDRMAEGEFANADDYMTVRFICDRGVSHQLVRSRVFSVNQESTRYCRYSDNVTFINPVPFFDAIDHPHNSTACSLWLDSCRYTETMYHALLRDGSNPQEARGVLTNSVKTELIMTGIIGDWDRLIEMRSAKDAHPQMRHLMGLLQQVYKKR